MVPDPIWSAGRHADEQARHVSAVVPRAAGYDVIERR
jgi:hypothetical protein